jgi:hypothetical protein
MMPKKSRICIEFPSRGETYCDQVYGVYEYDTYPRGSVLAGDERRSFLDSFESIEEARKAYPGADETGCQFVHKNLNHLPGEDL